MANKSYNYLLLPVPAMSPLYFLSIHLSPRKLLPVACKRNFLVVRSTTHFLVVNFTRLFRVVRSIADFLVVTYTRHVLVVRSTSGCALSRANSLPYTAACRKHLRPTAQPIMVTLRYCSCLWEWLVTRRPCWIRAAAVTLRGRCRSGKGVRRLCQGDNVSFCSLRLAVAGALRAVYSL